MTVSLPTNLAASPSCRRGAWLEDVRYRGQHARKVVADVLERRDLPDHPIVVVFELPYWERYRNGGCNLAAVPAVGQQQPRDFACAFRGQVHRRTARRQVLTRTNRECRLEAGRVVPGQNRGGSGGGLPRSHLANAGDIPARFEPTVLRYRRVVLRLSHIMVGGPGCGVFGVLEVRIEGVEVAAESG